MPESSFAQVQNERIFAESIVNTIREPLLVLDGQLRVVSANSAFYRLFRVSPEETEHRPIYELGNGQWSMDGLRHLLENVIPSNREFQGYQVDHDFPVVGYRNMVLNGRRIDQGEGREQLILLAIEDITERKRAEDQLVSTMQLIDKSPDIITRFDLEGRHRYVNKTLAEHVGRPAREIIGKMPEEIGIPPETAKLFREAFERVRATGKREVIEVPFGPGINQAFIEPETDRTGAVVSFAAYSRDITEVTRAQNELRESEAKYRSFVERANDGIIIVQDGTVKYANPRMAELDGSTVDRIVGSNFTEHVYPSEIPKLTEMYRRRIAGEKIPASYETILIRSNGEAAPAEISAAAVMFQGKPADMVIVHDITPFKRKEEELRRKETEFRTLAENSPDIIVRYGPDSRLRYANPKAGPIFGHPREEIIGKRITELGMPKQGSDYWESLIREIFSTGREKTVEFGFPPGERFFNAHLVPEFDENDVMSSVLSISRDVTGMKKNEETLRRYAYELRTLVDNSPDLIFRLNSRMRYEYVNSAYERLTGIPRERFTGKSNEELGMPRQLREYLLQAMTKVIESGQEHSMEFEMTSLFGKRYFTTRLIPEFIKSGRVETVLAIARDITERVRAEKQLRYVSFHDQVTGLYNRAFFEEELRRIDTERELPVSIIMGDIDNLKLVNDVCGHHEGDILLRAVAGSIRKACRTNDIIARWGGDEFTVILPRTDAVTAETIRSRISAIIGESRGTAIRPSMASGISVKERKDQIIREVVRRAEQAMYDNKLANSKQNETSVISSLQTRAGERSHDLASHIGRERAFAADFGKKLGLDEEQTRNLLLLVELHDIGSAIIPRGILTKPGRLTDEEWRLVKRHPEAGYRTVNSFSDTAKISEEVLAHGERWDGSGYPRGLKDKEIPFLARIFLIIDAYDIMTHPRPYARKLTREEAVEELKRNAGKQFDPELTEIFLRMLAKEPATAAR